MDPSRQNDRRTLIPGPSTRQMPSSELQPRPDDPVLGPALAAPSQQLPTTAPHNSHRGSSERQSIHHCPFCSEQFATLTWLDNHIKLKHTTALNSHRGSSERQSSHRCPYCAKQYTTSTWLNYHVKSKHTTSHNSHRKFSEQQNSHQYNSHRKLSEQQSSNHCPYCSKRYRTSTWLDNHIKIKHSTSHSPRMIVAHQDDRQDIDSWLLPFDSGLYSTSGEQLTAKAPTFDSLSEPLHAPAKSFACPYHKRQPGKYLSSSCSRFGFPSIDRLKEHLYRRHEPQPYCTCCYATFPNTEQLKQHQETGSCLPAPDSQKPPVEGITEPIKQQIQERHRGLTAEQKWTMLYKLLFPGDNEIPSPYHEVDRLFDHSISSEVLEFANFSQSIVPDLTRHRAEEAMREQRLEGLDDLLDLLPELSRAAGAEALDLWRAKKYLDDSTASPTLGVDEAFTSQYPTFSPDSEPTHNESFLPIMQKSSAASSAEGGLFATPTSSSLAATNYVCKLCGKSFSKKSNALRHEKLSCAVLSQHPRHQCSSCSKSYHRSDALRYHIAKEHPEPETLKPEYWSGKDPIREGPMELDVE